MGNFSDLPAEILLDILTRLPTETVLDCKLVCKPWRNHVRNPSFSQMHLTHLNRHDPAGKLTFLLMTEYRQFHYFEYNENDQETVPFHRYTIININPPSEEYNIIGSRNGLICLSACYDDTSTGFQPAYICNPITKECVILPKFNRVRIPRAHDVYCGFGYLQSSNEYKVVRIDQLRGKPNFECVEVYTLGSGNGWRNVGEYGLNSSLGYIVKDYGVFANETIYWITSKGKIVAFNLADEKFCEIPSLPCLSLIYDNQTDIFFGIGVLGGDIWCSIHAEHNRCTRTDIWLLKKNGNQNMIEQEEYLSFTWSKDFFDMKPLASMKSDEVLCYNHLNLYSYDIKSCCSKTLLTFPQFVYNPTLHMNTLISLKALGEEVSKTME